tara:strand:- start:12310 stop:14109 length:1800 start_codon:yes stop_codon:yes gene_type:complete
MVKTIKKNRKLKLNKSNKRINNIKSGGTGEPPLLTAAQLSARPPLNKISVSENMDKELAKNIRYKAKHKILGHIPNLANKRFGKSDLVKELVTTEDALKLDREEANNAALNAISTNNDREEANNAAINARISGANIENMSDMEIDMYLDLLFSKDTELHPALKNLDKKFYQEFVERLLKEKDYRKSLQNQVLNKLSNLSEEKTTEKTEKTKETKRTKKTKKIKKARNVKEKNLSNIKAPPYNSLASLPKKSSERIEREKVLDGEYAILAFDKRWIIDNEMSLGMLPKDELYEPREGTLQYEEFLEHLKEISRAVLINNLKIAQDDILRIVLDGWMFGQNREMLNRRGINVLINKNAYKQFEGVEVFERDMLSIVEYWKTNKPKLNSNKDIWMINGSELSVEFIKEFIMFHVIRLVKYDYLYFVKESKMINLYRLKMSISRFISLFREKNRRDEQIIENGKSARKKYEEEMINISKDNNIDNKTKTKLLRNIVKDMSNIDLYSMLMTSQLSLEAWNPEIFPSRELAVLELQIENRNRVTKSLLNLGWKMKDIQEKAVSKLDLSDKTMTNDAVKLIQNEPDYNFELEDDSSPELEDDDIYV